MRGGEDVDKYRWCFFFFKAKAGIGVLFGLVGSGIVIRGRREE